ncbi:hypothetical protein GG344DRAFT_82936 [Lentinula edodes]|nr:hypothetical protein GG344DRAFT_82936 [Lentinula edodes]
MSFSGVSPSESQATPARTHPMSELHTPLTCHKGSMPGEKSRTIRTPSHPQSARQTSRLTVDEEVFSCVMHIPHDEMIAQRNFRDDMGEDNEEGVLLVPLHKSKAKKTSQVEITSDFENNASSGSNDDEEPWKAHMKAVEQFDIPFEVPYRNSKWNLSGITSHTDFNTFLLELAMAMDTRMSLLRNISYLPSYRPKGKASEGPNDIRLENESDWISLIQNVKGYLNTRTARQVKQVWLITILDKTGIDSTLAKENTLKVTKTPMSTSKGSVVSTSDATLLVSLRKETKCTAYGDLNLWVELIPKHKAIIDKNHPPAEIISKMGEGIARQSRRAPLPLAPAPVQIPNHASGTSNIASKMQDMVMVMGTVAPLMHGLMQSFNSHGSKRHCSDSSSAPASSPMTSPHKLASATSLQNEELDIWLPKVDAGNVMARGLFDLKDLSGLNEETLKDLTGMEYGFANRLIRWAKDDLGSTKRIHTR